MTDTNTGHRNTGHRNTGHRNTGNWNAGNWSTGDRNTGNWNTGNWNTGHRNTGNCNTGDRNTGDRNTGNWNTGHRNTGNCNTGHRNTGNCNTGDRNTGDRNTGDRNTGDWNLGAYCTGFFNTEGCKAGAFNAAPFAGTEERDAFFNACPQWLFIPSLTTWVSEVNMSDQEKVDNPTFHTCQGYLRTNDMADEWRTAFASASAEDVQAVRDLPNFDAKVFEEITGLDLTVSASGAPKEIHIDGARYILATA